MDGSNATPPPAVPPLGPARMSLVWRIVALNSAVFALATVALALSPATVSLPVRATELGVLVAALAAILLINLLLVRRALVPIEKLTQKMRSADLLHPRQRLAVTGPAEVRELISVFNEMLDRLERERRESGRRALEAQEAERSRVARELHDEVGQVLTAVLLELDHLARAVPDELRNEMLGVRESARTSLEDVRRVARELRPETLDDLGLASALTALASRFTQQTRIRVCRHIDSGVPELPGDAQLAVYRIVQESLTNVARHAEARVVAIELTPVAAGVRLRVSDDGRGLDSRRKSGRGILGMRERAAFAGGVLRVGNAPSGGVEVVFDLPHPGAS